MKVYRKLIRPVHCYPGQGYEPKTELVEKEEKWYPEEEREHLEEKYGYLNKGHFSDLIFEEKYEPCLLKEQEETIRNLEQEIRDKNERLKERAEQVDSMLKERKPVEPSRDIALNRRCPKCFAILKGKFCHKCGQAVKWE